MTEKPLDNNNMDWVEEWAIQKARDWLDANCASAYLHGKAHPKVKSLAKELYSLKSQADELARALEFCLGKEVFPQGVCKEDKETESYTVAVKALSNYRKGE